MIKDLCAVCAIVKTMSLPHSFIVICFIFNMAPNTTKV